MPKEIKSPQIKKEEIRRIGQMEFEEAVQSLEGIVRELEDGRCSLNRNLELYERGVYLRLRCIELIEHAEIRLNALDELDAEASQSMDSPVEGNVSSSVLDDMCGV